MACLQNSIDCSEIVNTAENGHTVHAVRDRNSDRICCNFFYRYILTVEQRPVYSCDYYVSKQACGEQNVVPC
jgi:hypothetical protein